MQVLALILRLRTEVWLSAPIVSGCSASLLQHSLHPRKSLWGPCVLQQGYLWLPVVGQRVLPGVWGVLPVVQG